MNRITRLNNIKQNPSVILNQKTNRMQTLLQQFNKIDYKKQGSIKLSQAIKLIKTNVKATIGVNINLQRSLDNDLKINNVDQINKNNTSIIMNMGNTSTLLKNNLFNQQILSRIIFNNQNQVTFDQFLAMLYQTQIDLQINNSHVNQNIIDFLYLLQDYRKKCQDSSQYLEAQKAHQKILQIKSKQLKRHKQKLLLEQKNKVSSVNSLQKNKILQFNTAWNQYMKKYEQAAINQIEKLKARHLREMEEEEERIRQYYENYMKPSKKVIDLRSKEKNLAKNKEYQQAQRVKQYANKLFSKQKHIKMQQINQRIKKRKQTLQKHQQIALLALLKRIQKDRNQQLKQRQNDSQRMLVKLKNLQNDLVQKQSIQIKQTLVSLRETMCLTSGQLFGRKSGRMQSLGKLGGIGQGKREGLNHTTVDNVENNEDSMRLKDKPKEKHSFKIRVNSMHRVKLDNSMYDP